MNLVKEIQEQLKKTFSAPEDQIEVLDERGDGYHFIVRIRSEKFAEQNRLERSRMIYELLDEYLKDDRIHALRLDLKTPDERS